MLGVRSARVSRLSLCQHFGEMESCREGLLMCWLVDALVSHWNELAAYRS